MNRLKGGRRWLCALTSAVLLGISPAAGLADGIAWMPYEEALKSAERDGRPILLYFFIDNCVYCQRMDGQTLVARRVVDYLKDSFVSVRVDADRVPQLARKYMVRGFPTTWFLTPEGKPISSLPGYMAPDDFTKVLRYIGGGHYRSKSMREYLEGS